MDVRFTRCNPTASIATDCACSVPQVNAGRALRTTMHSACKIHYRQLAQIAIGNTYQQMTQGGRNVPVRMFSESIRRGCGEERKRTRDGYPSLQGSIRIHSLNQRSVSIIQMMVCLFTHRRGQALVIEMTKVSSVIGDSLEFVVTVPAFPRRQEMEMHSRGNSASCCRVPPQIDGHIIACGKIPLLE